MVVIEGGAVSYERGTLRCRTPGSLGMSGVPVEQIWRVQDSQGKILAFALMLMLFNPFKLCPLRSEAVRLETRGLRLGVRAVISRIPPLSTILALAKP